MDNSNSKRHFCQYGKACYRLNPQHFVEYSHEHLDNIMEQNANQLLDQYKFPDEMLPQKNLILDQIKVITALPKQSDLGLCAKRNKTDEKQSSPKPSSSKSSDNSCNQSSSSRELNEAKVDIHNFIKVVAPKGKMKEKLAAAAPFNFFLTTITSSKPTHEEPLSLTFLEILDPSLGELECSVQINFMIDIGWLLGQYFFAGNYFHGFLKD